jgi:excisionase family DNA binding protein
LAPAEGAGRVPTRKNRRPHLLRLAVFLLEHPVSQTSTAGPHPLRARSAVEPLVVPPREACQLLRIGLSKLYDLLRAGAIDSYLDNGQRRIPTKSLHEYVATKMAEPRRIGDRPGKSGERSKRKTKTTPR